MDKQHNWLSAQVAEGEAASSRIDEKAGAVRDEWFKIGHAFLAAKKLYPSTQAFGEWLRTSPLSRWSDNDRSCSMQLALHEEFARTALENTGVSAARTMWERVSKLLTLASYQLCEVEPDPISEPEDDANPPENTEIVETSSADSENPEGIQIAPRPAAQPKGLEKTIGLEAAALVRGWFTRNLNNGKRPLAEGIGSVADVEPIMKVVAAAVKSGECIHAEVAGSKAFDVRMAFPHIPKAVAIDVIGQGRAWKKLSWEGKGKPKSDWKRLAELNEICKAKSSYTVEKPAPNGTYRLREKRHEDEIAHGARQWWQSGHWPGAQVLPGGKQSAASPATVSSEAAIYYGMQVWPVDVASWRSPDDPTIPTKADADNTYWFVEELHRALVAAGVSHRTAAQRIRNWAKYIAALRKPAAAASVMQDMAQGIDTFALNPDSGLDLQNRMPARETKFAAEG